MFLLKFRNVFAYVLKVLLGFFFLFNITYILTKVINTSGLWIYISCFLMLLFVGIIVMPRIWNKVLFKINKLTTLNFLESSAFNIPFILLLTIITRVIFIYTINFVPYSDFGAYHSFAAAIMNGQIAGSEYISIFPNYFSYPAFLAIFYKIFGQKVVVAQILNLALSCGISVLIYFLGIKLRGKKFGVFASILWILWPSQILYTVIVSTELLFTFLMLLSIYVFVKYSNLNSNYYVKSIIFCAIGFITGILNAVRPLGIIILTAMILHYLYFVFEKDKIFSNKFISKLGFIFVLLFAYYLTSQLISLGIKTTLKRDIAKFPAGFSTYVGLNQKSSGLWNAEDSKMLYEIKKTPGITPQEVHNKLLNLAWERTKIRTLNEHFQFLLIKNNMIWPTDVDSIYYIIGGLDRENPSKVDVESYNNTIILVSSVYYSFMLLFAFCGILTKFRKMTFDYFYLLMLIILGFILIHMIVEVMSRYHFPIVPLFALFAAYGIVESSKLSLKPLNIQQRFKNKSSIFGWKFF